MIDASSEPLFWTILQIIERLYAEHYRNDQIIINDQDKNEDVFENYKNR